MNLESKRALQIFLVSILLLMSCDMATFAAPPQIPTPIRDAIKLMVAQTAAAAATETAALAPPTLTPTLTPFPSQTPVNTPTITPTFIFLLPTATSTKNLNGVFTCGGVSQSPANGTGFNPGQSFTERWRMSNTGSSAWLQGNVNILYISGTNFAGGTSFNLPKAVASKDMVTLTVNMTAPSAAGSYTTRWALATSYLTFCPLSLTITVN